jgi:hypothetical protein
VTSPERISTTIAFAKVKILLDSIEPRFVAGLIEELRAFEPQLLARAKAGVPTRKGARPERFRSYGAGRRPAGGVRSLISSQINEPERRLSVGLLTSQAASDGFYGFILDIGRGLKRTRTRPIKRQGTKWRPGRFGLTRGESLPYTSRIKPILPTRYDVTFGRVREWAREAGGPMLDRAYRKMLVALWWDNLS